MERQDHSITHRSLETLEEVYGIRHDELTGKYEPGPDYFERLHAELPDLPATVLKGLTGLGGGHLLPPERWSAYFAKTTLLPGAASAATEEDRFAKPRHRPERIYGVLGVNDLTLLGLVQPGAVLEIDHQNRRVDTRKLYPSIWDRPIYFLRTHDAYHCGWCDLDAEERWLTLVPSILAKTPPRRWKHPAEVEVVGVITRVLTRLGFSQGVRLEHVNRDQHSNSS